MKISGIVKSSLIDYPDKVAAVIFTQGCNFRCPFCHNPELIQLQAKGQIKEHNIISFLRKRKGLLDGVVITGGEPTVQKDLRTFIVALKELGYCVKLDTNGTSPVIIEELLQLSLVDYIAMDIKTSPAEYGKVAGKVSMKNILKSIEIIKNSTINYEFRTTVLPRLHNIESFEEIGAMIEGSNTYFIQNFRNERTLDPDYQNEKRFTDFELEEIRKKMAKYVRNVAVRSN